MSILVVEDNPVSARLIELNLRKHGYEVAVASSARQALDCLNVRPEIQLVITDIAMPEVDGLQLLNLIRERPELSDLSVIVCTSMSDATTVNKAIWLGCQHYLVKPIHADQLAAKVRQELRKEWQVLPDKFQIMSELGLDYGSFRGVASAFADLVDEYLDLLESRWAELSVDAIDQALSSLAESAAALQATRLFGVAARIRKRCSQQHGTWRESDVAPLIRELKALKHRLTEVLNER